MPAAEDFAQYKLQCIDYMQHDYEVMRPIVLCAETMAERSRQTGIERTSVGDKARRFVMEGMLGLVDQRRGHAGRKGHVYPEAVAAYMLYMKQLSPPIHAREVVRSLQRKVGYTTNHHTVKRFFARHALPVQLELQMPIFADFTEAYQARWTVVRLWYEGWNKRSIAGCLKLSRPQVYTILDAFERDGFAGLEDQRTRPPQHPGNQLTLPFRKEVLDIQREYPRAGRFRVHGLLETRREEAPPSEATVGRAIARNRQFHGAPGPWSSAREEAAPETTVRRRSHTSDSARAIGIICGSWTSGIWSNWRMVGSTASACWRGTPGKFWPGWPRPIRISQRCCNCSLPPLRSMDAPRW